MKGRSGNWGSVLKSCILVTAQGHSSESFQGLVNVHLDMHFRQYVVILEMTHLFPQEKNPWGTAQFIGYR
jgi:hypothetical protein